MRLVVLGVVEEATIGDLITAVVTNSSICKAVSVLVTLISVDRAIASLYLVEIEIAYQVRKIIKPGEARLPQAFGGSSCLSSGNSRQSKSSTPIQSVSSRR